MTALTDLRPDVAAEVMDCPNPTVDRAIIDAARDLCQAAAIWTDTIEVPITDGAGDYTLATSVPGAEIVRCIDPGCDPDGNPWALRDYRFTDARTLHAGPQASAQTLAMTISLRPKRGATDLPDVLALDRLEGVTAGALYRVLRMPGMQWSRPELAMYYGRLFQTARSNAIAAVERGFAHTGVRAQPRRLAAFRR